MIWQRFVTLENHDLANYVTEKYLLDIANATNNKVLAETITSYKNTSIGTKAPNFDIYLGQTTTSLHQLEGAENYLVIFWSSGCSHCLNELPKIREMIANKPNLKVVAFGLEDDTIKWSEEIKNYPNFIHVIGLGKWDNQTVQTYGIASTPTYFLLNKEKIIIAKPYEYLDVELTIKNL